MQANRRPQERVGPPMNPPVFRRRSTLAASGLTLTALSLAALGASPPAHSSPQGGGGSDGISEVAVQTTDDFSSFFNLNPEVVRGMCWNEDEDRLFAIHSYASSIVRFDGFDLDSGTLGDGVADEVWRTLVYPVSIAEYADDVLVVGQGTHGIVRHNGDSGEIVDALQLSSEPADLIVDATRGVAWVSCMGTDEVLELDLSPRLSIRNRYRAFPGTGDGDLQVKRPRHLELDEATGAVYVAPFLSGNNTMLFSVGTAGNTALATHPDLREGVVYDFANDPDDLLLDAGGGLPDVDLFRIVPDAGGGLGDVERIVRGAGTLMTAHGWNSAASEYWLLNVDLHNAEPDMQNEPDLKGEFATNQVTRLLGGALPLIGTDQPIRPSSIIDLDLVPTSSGLGYESDRSVSFPYALAFDDSAGTGLAAVGSATSPRVVLLNSSAQRTADLELGSARVVRSLDFAGEYLFGYCQQTSELVAWEIAPTVNVQPVATFDLGHDPTPPGVQAGRAIFYDATASDGGRTSCNTCHPGGESDLLSWNLSEAPLEEKGPMLTQSLRNIEDTFPYHWRGERDLEAFNDAFPNLLGTTGPLSGSDFADFQEFVFSLRSHANPGQDPSRLVVDALGGPAPPGEITPDATAGVTKYLQSCVDCHLLPTGTTGGVNNEVGTNFHAAQFMENIQLNNMTSMKEMPWAAVDLTGGGSLNVPFLGTGFLHSGRVANAFEFLDEFFLSGAAPADRDDFVHVLGFLRQFDFGVAPNVHALVHMDDSNAQAAHTQVDDLLLPQAEGGWLGVVAIGTVPSLGGGTETVHFLYDTDLSTPLFVSEDPQVQSNRDLDWFRDQALLGTVRMTFFGVPPGNETRLGLDFDGDGLIGLIERSRGGDPWNPNTDGDSPPHSDGYEFFNGGVLDDPAIGPRDVTPPSLVGAVDVEFLGGNVAKFRFEASEEVQWRLDPASAAVAEASSMLDYDRFHTVVVHGLDPTTRDPATNQIVLSSYDLSLEVFDRAGHALSLDLPAFDAALTQSHREQGVVTALSMTTPTSSTGSSAGLVDLSSTVTIDLETLALQPNGAPRNGLVVICQVFESPSLSAPWTRVPADRLEGFFGALALEEDYFVDPFDSSGVVPYSSLAAAGRGVPGPFLLTTGTNPSGQTSFDLTVSDAPTGSFLRVQILGAGEAIGRGPGGVGVELPPTSLYALAPTDPGLRGVDSKP